MTTRNSSGFFGTLIFLTLLLGIVVAALGAVFLMVGLRLIHGDVPAVPALGFWASFGTLLVLSGIGHALRGAKADFKT